MGAGTNIVVIVLVIAIAGVGLELVYPNFLSSVFPDLFQVNVTVATMGGNPLASIPISGIVINGQSGTSPFTVSVSRFQMVTVSVPQTFIVSGVNYTFAFWSPSGSILNTLAFNVYASLGVSLIAEYSSGETPPPQNNTIFSDGFESGSFANWNGLNLTSGESATVVGSAAHQGNYGALFSSNGGGGYESAYCYKNIASSTADLYARGYFYVSQSGITSALMGSRFYFLLFSAGSNQLAYVGWRMVGTAVQWDLLIRNGTAWIDFYNTANVALNQWYSIELHLYESATAGYAQAYVNGALVCSSQTSPCNTAYYGVVSIVRFGLAELYNCTSTTMYGDATVVNNAYIGP